MCSQEHLSSEGAWCWTEILFCACPYSKKRNSCLCVRWNHKALFYFCTWQNICINISKTGPFLRLASVKSGFWSQIPSVRVWKAHNRTWCRGAHGSHAHAPPSKLSQTSLRQTGCSRNTKTAVLFTGCGINTVKNRAWERERTSRISKTEPPRRSRSWSRQCKQFPAFLWRAK